MGGVNFTRNRAWWHTAIWDEYGQRHQYLCFFPATAYMFPIYWYGVFVNREIDQNFAAKMYQLEYETKRNRLTHNLIMEHFETHVEKVQDLLDYVKDVGFEKAFEYEIKHPLDEQVIREDVQIMNEELLAEIDEHSGWTDAVDGFKNYSDSPFWIRQELEKNLHRRKHPHSPYKFLSQISDHHDVIHRNNAPFEGLIVGKNTSPIIVDEP